MQHGPLLLLEADRGEVDVLATRLVQAAAWRLDRLLVAGDALEAALTEASVLAWVHGAPARDYPSSGRVVTAARRRNEVLLLVPSPQQADARMRWRAGAATARALHDQLVVHRLVRQA